MSRGGYATVPYFFGGGRVRNIFGTVLGDNKILGNFFKCREIRVHFRLLLLLFSRTLCIRRPCCTRQGLGLFVKGPGTYLLEPVVKENCENSKFAHGSTNKVNAEMLSEKVVLRKLFRLVISHDDVTVTSPKIRKSLIFLQIMKKKLHFVSNLH